MLVQDIIDKHAENHPQTTAEALTRTICQELAVVPRTQLPQIKYDEADQAYEHTMGHCHESFGSAAALDVAAEWFAIAEHMAAREAAAAHAQTVADLARAFELGYDPFGYGDADLEGMDS